MRGLCWLAMAWCVIVGIDAANAQDYPPVGEPLVSLLKEQERLITALYEAPPDEQGARLEDLEETVFEIADHYEVLSSEHRLLACYYAVLGPLTLAQFSPAVGGDLSAALEWIEHAKGMATLGEHAFSILTVDREEALIWMTAGKLAEAEAGLISAIHRHREAGIPSNVFSLQTLLADVCRQLREPSRALDLLDEAYATFATLTDAEKRGHRQQGLLADLHGVRGQTKLRLGLMDLAYRDFELEKEEAEWVEATIGDPRYRFISYSRRMDLWIATAQFERALLESRQARRLMAGINPYVVSHLLGQEAIALVELEELDPGRERLAETRVTELLAQPEGTMEPFIRVRSKLNLARIHLGKGELEPAEQLLRDCQRQLSGVSESDLDEWALLEMVILAGLEAEALLLRDEVDVATIRACADRMTQSFERMIQAWRHTPIRDGGVNFLHDHERRMLLGELLGLLWTMGADEHAEEAFDRLVEAQACGTLSRLLKADAPSRQQVSEVREEGEGLLAFAAGRHASFVFLIDDLGLDWFRLDGHRSIEMLAEGLNDLLAPAQVQRDGSVDAFRQASQSLAEAVLPKEVQVRLEECSAVRIIGGSTFGEIAWEALEWDGEWWALRQPVWRVPSFSILTWLAAPVDGTPRDAEIVLLGAPTHLPADVPNPDRHPELPLTLAEREQLRAASNEEVKGPVIALFREDAHLAAVEEVGVEHAAILHLFCHGLYQRDLPVPATLLLAPPPGGSTGIVNWRDLERLPSADFVMLSACGAATGKERMGEDGLAHLGGQFLRYGSRCVALAAGTIALRSTLRLTTALQDGLLRGESPASAILAARRATAALPGFEHPFHFAQLRLVGDAGSSLFPGRFVAVAQASEPEATSEEESGSAKDESGGRSWWWIAAGAVLLCFVVVGIRRCKR